MAFNRRAESTGTKIIIGIVIFIVGSIAYSQYSKVSSSPEPRFVEQLGQYGICPAGIYFNYVGRTSDFQISVSNVGVSGDIYTNFTSTNVLNRVKGSNSEFSSDSTKEYYTLKEKDTPFVFELKIDGTKEPENFTVDIKSWCSKKNFASQNVYCTQILHTACLYNRTATGTYVRISETP